MGLFDKLKMEKSINKKLKEDELSKTKQKVSKKHKDAGLTDKEIELLAKKEIKKKKAAKPKKDKFKPKEPSTFEIPKFKF